MLPKKHLPSVEKRKIIRKLVDHFIQSRKDMRIPKYYTNIYIVLTTHHNPFVLGLPKCG